MWNEKLELPSRSCFLSNIWDYFAYIIKKHEKVTHNPSIRIYVSKIENRITSKTKKGYYIQLLTPETTKVHGNTKSKIPKDENGENVSHLEITEVVLVHCNIVINDYQQNSRVLYKLVPNKLFCQLLDISSKNFIFLNTFYSEFSYTEVWFTDQDSKPKIN